MNKAFTHTEYYSFNTIVYLYMEYIYKLIDPNNRQVMYIGYTKNNPMVRLANHILDTRRERKCETPKSRWVKVLIDNYQIPIIKVIRSVKTGGRRLEKYYINKYLSRGHKLLNLPLGGYRKESPIYGRGKLGISSKPIIGIHKKTGNIRHFPCSSSAQRKLNSEGIKVKNINIRHVVLGTKNSKGVIRKSAGGYFWKSNHNKK